VTRSTLWRLLLLALIWGSSFLLIKFAIEGVSPVQLVLGRLVAGAAVLLVILAVRGQRLPAEPAVWGHVALLAVVANIVPFFLFAWGELRITSGMAGILNGTTPLFTLGFAVAALPEERLSRARFMGFLLGFAGVVVVVGPWNGGDGVNALSGQLACLLAAACYGVAFVYTRRFVAKRGYPPLVVSAAQLLTATVLLGVFAPFVATQPMELTALVVGSVLILGAVGTGLAYLLFYRLITDAGATTASMVTYLIPIVAVVLGVVVQSDPLTWNLFVGAAIVIAGAAMAEGRLRLRPSVEAPVVPARQE
jgi:drug/metabolite transporter (DMT)-like permease